MIAQLQYKLRMILEQLSNEALLRFGESDWNVQVRVPEHIITWARQK